MTCETGNEKLLDNPRYALEQKADGTHICIIKQNETIRIFGRPKDNGEMPEYTNRLPDLIEAAKVIPSASFEIVGEAVVFKDGRTFFEGSQRRCSTQSQTKIEMLRYQYPIVLLAFDLTELDGKRIEHWKWEDRKRMLKDLLDETPQRSIVCLPHYLENKRQIYEDFIHKGEEGVTFINILTLELRMKKTDRAYLAGFLDADGAFFINWAIDIPYKRLAVAPCIAVGVAQNQRAIIDYLHKLVGLGRTSSWIGNAGLVLWQIKRRDQVRALLNEILPYLVIKKTQAELLLEALDILEEANNSYPKRRTREQFLRLAKISDGISDRNTKRKKGKQRKWTYVFIEKLLDETGIGKDERLDRGWSSFMQSGEKTRFKSKDVMDASNS